MEGRESARLESLEHVYMPKGSRAESRGGGDVVQTGWSWEDCVIRAWLG